MIDVIDSYYLAVQAQMQNVNPAQAFGGVVPARDWPMTPPVYGALYLLVLSHLPIGGTEAQILMEYQCQWVWLLDGTNIPSGSQAANRGDRYRSNFQIELNLRNANFPQFTQKVLVTADPVTGALTKVPVQSTYPVSQTEQIWWGALRFMPKQDNEKSGLIYGAAAVQLYGYSDVQASLAA